jgi:hypothetical protein
MQLQLPHRALEPQDQPVVGVVRVVDAVLVGQQGAEEAADLQQVVTVLARAGQAADLQAEDQADVPEGDLGQQPLEAGAGDRRLTALALILVDDQDPLGRPAQADGVVGQRVLAVGRLAVVADLLGAGLTDVDDGQPVQVPALNLRPSGHPWWAKRPAVSGPMVGPRPRGA